MKYIKSPLNYTGGKYKLLKKILPLFPEDIDIFVDLFSGGYNVGINVDAKRIIANDHNEYIIDLYRDLQRRSYEEVIYHIEHRIEEYSLSKENREGYNSFREDYNSASDKNLIDLLILSFYSFNHQIRFNNSHKFNTPFGYLRSSFNPSIKNNLYNFMTKISNQNLEFHGKDFLEIDFAQLTKDSLVYCDPPYLISNAVYNDGKRGFKDWTEVEEQALLSKLDELNDAGVKFALSNVLYHKGEENRMLIDWSQKYNIHFMNTNYSNSSYHLKNREQKTIEVLITNY